MSDLTDYPRQDKFETTLSQDLDSSATTIFLVTAPSFSLVVGQSCEMIIDYNSNTKYERCTLSGPYTAGVNPLTTITRGNPKYSGGASTAVAHSGGAKVIFAPTYADFENAATAINSKINKSGGTFTGEVNFTGTTIGGVRLNNLTTVQRDALASPANGMMIYNTTTGEVNQYLAGAWSAVASGSTQPNASTTVAGKVEVATQAENNAGTSTGGTGALLSTTPDVAAVTAQNNKWVNCVVGGTADVITLTPTPAITAYVDGQEFVFLATGTNTTNVTANVSTLGAKAVTKNGTQVLVAGDMVSGCAYRVRYDGTRLQIVGSGSPFGFTAKGDMVQATGANTSSKLPVGTDGQYIIADSTAATGSKYVNTFSINASELETDYFTVQIPRVSSGDDTPWTVSGNAALVYNGQGVNVNNTGINAHPKAYLTSLLSIRTGAAIAFGASTNLRLKFSAISKVGGGVGVNFRSSFIGFSVTPTSVMGDITVTTDKRVGFAFYNGNLYAIACDGAAITASLIGAYAAAAIKRLEIILNNTTSFIPYVNGVAQTAVSTNLPSSGNIKISAIGDTALTDADSGFDFVGQFIYSEKLS